MANSNFLRSSYILEHPSPPQIVKWIKLQRMNHFLMYLKNETFSSLIHGQNVCTV